MDKLFLDTNLLLDVLEKRAPWFPESAGCLAKIRRGESLGAVSALSLSDISYIQKSVSNAKLYEVFHHLRTFLDVAESNGFTVDACLERQLPDIEDGFQLEAALHWGATHFLTRNVKDFPATKALVIQTPAEYLSGIR